MSDELHITLSPATSYATRRNILFPGSDAQATAEAAKADARIEDTLKGDVSGLTVTANDE